MSAVLVSGRTVYVDPQDIPLCLSLKLRIINKTRHKKKKLYVEHCERKNGHHIHLSLHRLILNISDPKILVDHRDGNTMNNRRENLRPCTCAENARNAERRADNTSGYRGVIKEKRSGKWRAMIQVNGRRVNLGLFEDPAEASKAYALASSKLHGEFGRAG